MKIFIGKVVSKKMEKTATVAVERIVVHPVYKKRFKRIKKYHVHDEMGADLGQTVKFIASKPYSRTKKWKIVEIIGNESRTKGVQSAAIKNDRRKKIISRRKAVNKK
ncbi:MAG: 30S ribosomal protein S17 [Candidatus Woesebacteria bacterium GW2011_GWB1_39_12]|uniref:Small ribosomal subunit protein uS17 n=2 Tax=Candidatus Woeseibacteriota TaxID=1752722 RepID=A0A0G0PIC3_9BACT|nr:MAG: 30S ribosomal protein S17 [Candidatus Woesebacteria bacterium GW2011_GWB1_39_12]